MTETKEVGRHRLAREFQGKCQLTEQASRLLTDRLTVREFFEQMIDKGLLIDAVRFAACCLPKREAIWWACLCLWERHQASLAAPAAEVFRTVIDWVREPDDCHRRAVEAAGRAVGIATPLGNLATAVFYNEGSISLPGLPEVPPDPDMTAKMVAQALVATLRKLPRERVHPYQLQWLRMAAEVVAGNLPWDAPLVKK